MNSIIENIQPKSYPLPDIQVAPPSLFQIELTGYCNIDCAMCARSAGLKRPIGHMDIELFKELVDQSAFYKMPIHWMHHFGETLLYPHLREALRYFRANGYGPGHVSTNAIALNAEHIDILLESASYVLCCIDTLDPEAYVKIRNNKHFERVKQNIENFITERNRRNLNTKIVIQFLRTRHNYDEDITRMMEHFGAHQNVKYIEKRTDKHPNGGDITIFGGKFDKHAVARATCPKMSNELAILWSGECVPCCWDADGEQVIGNVLNNTIGEIWQNETHRRFQQSLKDGVHTELPLCKKCTGPVDDANFGIIEQVNAWTKEWVANGDRVVIAPASLANYSLLKTSQLSQANIVGFVDAVPDKERPASPYPVLPYSALDELKPDSIFIYSPSASTDIYFQLRHLRERGVKLYTLGGHLD